MKASGKYRVLFKVYEGEKAIIVVNLAVEAGKAKLTYALALTDCYVLAASKIYSCKALFKKPEREMLKNIDSLKKEYEIIFLTDYR